MRAATRVVIVTCVVRSSWSHDTPLEYSLFAGNISKTDDALQLRGDRPHSIATARCGMRPSAHSD